VMPVTIDKLSQVSPEALVADNAQVLGTSVVGPGCAVYGRAVLRDCVLLNGAAVFGNSNLTGLILDGRVICFGHVEQAQGKTYDKRAVLSPDRRFART